MTKKSLPATADKSGGRFYLSEYLRFMRLIHLRDAANFLSKLTPARLFNFLLVWISYQLTRFSGNPVHYGKPVTISIEPTTACNLRCPECPSGLRAFTRPTGRIDTDFFRKTIDELQRELLYLIFYFQGEPYLHPRFLDMVTYAREKKIYTITSTNGHFLSEENARRTVESGLDRIIISIDGTTQEVYEQYRREGNLETVLEGARRLVRYRRELSSVTPHIVFQFLVVRPNEHQIPEVYRLAREIGVDEVKLKSAQLYEYENGHPLMPTRLRYSRYAPNGDGSYRLKYPLLDHCWKLWHACTISWDGQVLPCCFDKDARHALGDLKETSFDRIWKGKAYASFRRRLLKGRAEIDICANC
ncbi:MAG: radical SAM/SPASM domain-containing protein, partial [Saprospiraceae bacterium]|nr:radical SAM/SPASM domain-containing protein [Saprospiraceae bacterium]